MNSQNMVFIECVLKINSLVFGDANSLIWLISWYTSSAGECFPPQHDLAALPPFQPGLRNTENKYI